MHKVSKGSWALEARADGVDRMCHQRENPLKACCVVLCVCVLCCCCCCVGVGVGRVCLAGCVRACLVEQAVVVAMIMKLVCAVRKCLFSFLSGIFGRKVGVKEECESQKDNWQSSGEWEDFSIAVIPSNNQPSEKTGQDYDVFSDMQPVIKKAKKVGHFNFIWKHAHV